MKISQSANVSKYYTIGLAVLPAAAGSTITFMFVIAALAGVVDVFRKKIAFGLSNYDKIIVYPALAFFAVNALSIVRFDFQVHDLASLIPSVLFLLPYFFIKRYRYTGKQDHFQLLLKAIPFGAFLLLPWIIYEGLYLGHRMSAGAGNAIPFGMICALMMPICLMYIFSRTKLYQLVAVFGFVIFGIGLVFSQSRGMYIAAVPNILIALGYLIYQSKQRIKVSILAALILIIGGIFISNSTIVAKRSALLIAPFASILNNSEISDASVGNRYALLKKGLCFAQDRVVAGYGISNRREVLISEKTHEESYVEFCSEGQGVFYNSHFHNGFLTAFIDAGIFGLLATIAMLFAPISLAVFSPNDGVKPLRIAVALCLTSVYVMAGFTNLLFGHDLIDAMFLIFATYLALSIKDTKNI